ATLDPETLEVVRAALDAAMEGDHHAGDTRTSGQRRCDALGDVCRLAMAHMPDGPGRHNPPHISGVLTVDTIAERGSVDLAQHIRAEAAHGPLSRATLERLACDGGFSRIIVDGDSQPLDVGRATRTATPAQWRALVVRDRGCTDPGCDRPPGWCQVHHRKWWDRDHGETNLDNLELRCHHHRAAHHQNRPPPRE
ncbi:MAG: hypothetical protein JWL83_3094, partial [Actinomycetia bacterium]|nr:hypothetical protein [Actinomycetes bacterium]